MTEKSAFSHIHPLPQMDLYALSRIREGGRAWYPDLYGNLLFQLTESIVKEFLGGWLGAWPLLLANHSNQVTTTLTGLVIGLEQCFAHRGYYEQALFSYPYITNSMMSLWDNMYQPEEDSALPGITMEDTENLASPWAKHADDEHFVTQSVELVANIVQDDPVTAKLLTLLIFFSSDKKDVEDVMAGERDHIRELLLHHIGRAGFGSKQVTTHLNRVLLSFLYDKCNFIRAKKQVFVLVVHFKI